MATTEPTAYNENALEKAYQCQAIIEKLVNVDFEEYKNDVSNIAVGDKATELASGYAKIEEGKHFLQESLTGMKTFIGKQEELRQHQ